MMFYKLNKDLKVYCQKIEEEKLIFLLLETISLVDIITFIRKKDMKNIVNINYYKHNQIKTIVLDLITDDVVRSFLISMKKSLK